MGLVVRVLGGRKTRRIRQTGRRREGIEAAKSERMHSRLRGFSLVELLIVMALVTCAYAFMFGPGTAWSQGRAKAQCARQLQQMHAALTLFAAEHDGAFPASGDARASEPALSQLVPLYTTDTTIFICPGSGHSGLPGALGLRAAL